MTDEKVRIMKKQGFVYILTNKSRTVLYIGVTSDLQRRILEHKAGKGSQFSTKYKTFDLLYFEQLNGMQNAIDREKQLKNWHKDWKWNIIKEENPNLIDIASDWFSKNEIEEFTNDK
jgi:putative endonuclease